MQELIDLTRDGHVHTRFCHHALGEMEEYVQAAIAKGLTRLTFLEHFEIGIRYFESTWLSRDDFDAYLLEGKRLKEKYLHRIKIGLGVETGFKGFGKKEFTKLLDQS